MLKEFRFISLLFILLLNESSAQLQKKSEEEILSFASDLFAIEEYEQAIAVYRNLLIEYPNSEKAIFAFNQIAGIQMENLHDFRGAINTYRELTAAHQNSIEGKESSFMVAYIYDEELLEKENAKSVYREFLSRYCVHDIADRMCEAARTMLEVLESGKSIEEMIEDKIKELSEP